jgi:porin
MGKMRYGLYLGATALACAWSGLSTPVHAQGMSDSSMPMFDSVSAMGKSLAASGIFLSLGYTEDISRLASGGVPGNIGWHPIGHASAGVTFDLETIAGLTGSSLHVIFEERPGIAMQAGTDVGLNQNAGPVKYRLTQFYWEQGFDHDRIDIQVGRTEPTLEFGVGDLSCAFVTGVFCAQPGTWYSQNKNGAYPASEWGGRVNLAVTPEIYVKAGAYQDTPLDNGFMSAGFDWRTEGSTGVFVPVEIGYLTGFSSVQLPAKYDAGFWYDTSQYTKGNQAGNPTVTGRSAGYLQLQQTVWRPEMATRQSVTLFGGAIWYNNSAAYSGQYYAGIWDRAPFGSLRPDDTIGLVGTLLDINQNATSCVAAFGCTGTPHRGSPWPRSAQFELNYGIGILTGVSAKPYVAWVLQPFTQGNAAANTKNAVAFGVEFSVVLDQLFHFPVFVPH